MIVLGGSMQEVASAMPCRQTTFILGPSHHKYTPRCALSQATSYETPLVRLGLSYALLPCGRPIITALHRR